MSRWKCWIGTKRATSVGSEPSISPYLLKFSLENYMAAEPPIKPDYEIEHGLKFLDKMHLFPKFPSRVLTKKALAHQLAVFSAWSVIEILEGSKGYHQSR